MSKFLSRFTKSSRGFRLKSLRVKKKKAGGNRLRQCYTGTMTTLDPSLYPRTLEQAPIFGVGVYILIGIDEDDRYTVFDRDGLRYFGPVAFGEFPEDHPWVDPKFLRVNRFSEAKGEEREGLWCRDLMMMAGHFHKLRLTADFQDIDLHGSSLAPLIGRIGKADEDLVKALGLWHRRVELIEDVRGLGAWLPKGTIGVVGTGDYAYTMGGMFAYDVELPMTDLEPHGRGKTLGIGYEKLRLLRDPSE